MPHSPRPSIGRGLAAEERLEVHAGGEEAARAGEDAGPQLVGRVELVDRGGDAAGDRRVEGVARLRPVDGDDLHGAAALDQYLVGHVSSSGPGKRTRGPGGQWLPGPRGELRTQAFGPPAA